MRVPEYRFYAAVVTASVLLLIADGMATAEPVDWLEHHAARQALIERFEQEGVGALDALTEALAHPSPAIQRTAAQLIVRVGEPALARIERLLDHEDFRIRAIAIRGLSDLGVLGSYRKRIEADPHPSIRRDAEHLYFLDRLLLAHPLPAAPWRFSPDPEDIGRDRGWFRADFDDGTWRDDAAIEVRWAEFLGSAYIGAGWYRRTIELPEFPEGWDRAELAFEGVDEMTWVWVNGAYVGEHDIGVHGWNQPFVLDVTEAIRPGEANQVTIRVENTVGAGGIWRPVDVRVYRAWRERSR